MQRSSLILFLFLFTSCCFAQQFGGFKPSKMWLYLNKDNYSIIYTAGNEKRAQQVASIFQQMDTVEGNIGLKRRNITTVFQQSTTQANGYVGLAPFVSEYFLTPLPNSNLIGSLPWHYTLGIHEYQHVLQFSNSRNGIGKWAYYIGGQAAWSVAIALSVPNWFFEGDAVRAETEHTHQGRGRIPHFFSAYRAYVAHGESPHYFKLRSGSIRDLVPDHYRLGYLMISYGREKYGEQFWAKTFKEATAYKGVFYPFSRALKRNSGMHSRQFFDSSMQAFSKKWEYLFAEPALKSIQNATPIGSKKKSVNNYYFPQFTEDTSLVFSHASFDQAAHFYSLKKGEITKHRPLGLRSGNYFDCHRNQLIFTQTYFDSRWTWTDFSDIVVYDLKEKSSKRITKGKKYFHPSFSLNGQQIAVLESTPNGEYSIHILQSSTGELQTQLPNPNNYYYSYAQWLDSNTLISACRDSLGRMAITQSSTLDGSTENLSPWTYHIVGKPMLLNNKVYFSASYSGIDNLYELDLDSKEIYQLTQGGLGQYQPFVNSSNDSIYFSTFSLQGYQLQSASIKDLNRQRVESITPLEELSPYQNSFLNSSSQIHLKSDRLEATPYRKSKSLLNFHSWTPLINNPNYSLSVTSDNVLNTLDLTVGYEYNSNENSGGFEAQLDYGQYYLHLNAELNRRNRSIDYRTGTLYNKWIETEVQTGFSLPLQLSKNQYLRRLNLFAYYNYLHVDFSNERFGYFEIHGSHLGFSYRQQKLKAQKNIFTHFGLFANFSQKNSVDEPDLAQSLIQTSIALPGLSNNHNLLIDLDAQFRKGILTYQYRDNFQYSRGFEQPLYQEFYKASFNYHFPLLYPDKGALGIAFLQRVRSNVFFDYSLRKQQKQEFNSIGVELIFDFKWLHEFPFPLGVRYLQLLSSKSFGKSENANSWEIFIPFARF